VIKQSALALRRLFGRSRIDPHGGSSFYYKSIRRDGAGSSFEERWSDIALVADLRATDTVLDLGCAEGLIAMHVARVVHRVHGIELLPHRVDAAAAHARQDGIENVTFATGSVVHDDLPPAAYDVTLFLGLYGYPVDDGRIGTAELSKALIATRRQIILRVDVQDDPEGIPFFREIYDCFDSHGFDGLCFPKVSPRNGNVILGNRRGAGAHLPYLPPVLLLPTGSVVPIKAIDDATSPDTPNDTALWTTLLTVARRG
jgi:SAM-dependent methyltransferase